ncbi:MAG: hypothetical protein PUI16_05475 [Clostridia bacterium]|nr:hypothetical protein [Clostridia bacterium]MDY5555187.1 hypothetical protein [Blautia sp.]
MRRKQCKGLRIFTFILIILCISCSIEGAAEIVYAEENDTTGILQEELIGEMEFDEIQKMMDELLGNNSFSFSQALRKIMNGDQVLSKETVLELLRSLFFFGNRTGKEPFL